MPFHKWVFNGRIKKHEIEVNHDPQLQKLLIKLNGTKVVYEPDFHDTLKEYFLIIDNELCTLRVEEKQAGTFDYSLRPSTFLSGKKIISPEKKQAWQLGLAFSGVIAFFALVIFFSVTYLDLDSRNASAMEKPIATFGIVHYTGTDNFNTVPETSLAYQAGSTRYLVSIETPNKYRDAKLAPNGMPVFIGDGFQVVYDAKNPGNAVVFFNRPNKSIQKRYEKEAHNELFISLKKFKKLDVEDSALWDYCGCIIDFVSKEFGVEGLANIYFLQARENENEQHNYDSYKSLINNNIFRKRELSCRNAHLTELTSKK